jgi:cytochrome P450
MSESGVDVSALSFWARPPEEREAAFAVLRAEQPVSRQRQPEGQLMPQEEGAGDYWAVVRYDDVRAVSRDPATFCSGRGVMFEDVPEEMLEASQSFLAMDDPRHKKLRALVSAGFSPRQVRLIEDGIRQDTRQIVDELEAGQTGDFVERVAKRLPLMTIMRMLGVPESDRERLVHYADAAVSWNDPEYLNGRQPLEVTAEAMGVLHAAASELAERRQNEPSDDLISALVHAEVDGERLTQPEIAAFFVLLSVAGNDTTRHTTSHAMRALSANPDQRRLLLEDLDGRIESAVEEFVRWATPVMTFCRTATRDTELHGQAIAEGEKVALFYSSANRDESAFEDPGAFRVLRDPNRHVGFGGGGPHYCMGASMARTQLRSLFGELLTRFPDIEVGEPRYLVGNFVNGVSELPMDTGPSLSPPGARRRS